MTRFYLKSSVADRVELCLFDPGGIETRIPLRRIGSDAWGATVDGIAVGQRYGFRVAGSRGGRHRCNPHKLLLDPNARGIAGDLRWHPSLAPLTDAGRRDPVDSARHAPKSVVCAPLGPPAVPHPRIPLDRTVIYEAHVKGLTQTHPAVPMGDRGTYRGLAHPAVIAHLTSLGITAVELLPIQAFLHSRPLVEGGRSNYWGYAPVSWLAPHPGYAPGAPPEAVPAMVQAMVSALHRAGIEVFLDVVYNHTGEGDLRGAVVAGRGIDDVRTYRQDDRGDLVDLTGTGNTVDVSDPWIEDAIVASVVYWVEQIGIDGFRFDLAPVLCRDADGAFSEDPPLWRRLRSDPRLSGTKWIAEPWDLGPDGYRLGTFGAGISEWNDRYRDDVRDYWRGAPGSLPRLAQRLTGSADVFCPRRPPTASINFVTAHDGFTLTDLVSYAHKHNRANGEDNRDGSDQNRSVNFGVEGPTDDPRILADRRRQQRALLATLLVSTGIPMILAGDELGRTQGGNNNAYAQDNETSWVDWATADPHLLAFTQRLLAVRRAHPALHRATWLPDDPSQVGWFTPDGRPMDVATWEIPTSGSVGLLLRGDRSATSTLFLIFHNGSAPLCFALPLPDPFVVEIDTADPRPGRHGQTVRAQRTVAARSVVVLSQAPDATDSGPFPSRPER